MKVVITGGCGFIGQRLAQRLLEKGSLVGPSGRQEEIDKLTLFDTVAPPDKLPKDPRAELVTGDIANWPLFESLIDRDDISVFHLASVVSGGGEKDFDAAMRINLNGGLNVFQGLRQRESVPRLVFASSIAVFGGAAMPETVGDLAKQTPQTTYGMTKAVCELMINDYSRKGFFDGRSARLPTVVIRPGKPNAAASSFASGVFREPLNGEPCVLPVETSQVMPLLGYRSVVEGFIRLHEVEAEALGDDRAVSLPSLVVDVAEMIAALRRVAGERPLGEITVAPDPFIQAICATWPRDSREERADALGLPKEGSVDEIVEAYIEDYL